MILNSPYISGSLTVTGNTVLSGSVTLASGASLSGTASLATSASFAVQSQTASFVVTAQTASYVALAQSASNAVTAQTASFANTFTVNSILTAQTLVVQTITSSVSTITGSTNFGSLLANTHQFTGSVLVTGSITSQGGFILGNSQAISLTGSIGYNNAVGLFIYGKSGSEADFRLYNSAGLTAMSVVAGTQNVLFNGNIQSKVVDVVAGTSAAFSFGIDHQSTFAFGSTNGRRIAILRNSAVDDNGLQFGYDTTDKTGIIAGSATTAGAGIDFYTYNGSSWGNKMRITAAGNIGINNNSPSASLDISKAGGLTFRSYYGSGNNRSLDVNIDTNNGDAQLTWNTYYSGGWKYFTANSAARIYSGNGIGFSSAPAGSANGAITWNDAMFISSSGFVGINTSSPLTRVHIVGSSGSDLIRFDAGVNTKFLYKLTGAADDPFTLRRTHPTGGDLDIMTWTYNGRVGIGTTEPSTKLQVVGDSILNGSINIHNGMTLDSNNYSNSITTSWVNIGPTTLFVGLAYVYWANDSSAVRDFALISFNYYPAGVTTIASSNNGGNGVVFQMSGSSLQMKTTSGTVIGTQVVWFKV